MRKRRQEIYIDHVPKKLNGMSIKNPLPERIDFFIDYLITFNENHFYKFGTPGIESCVFEYILQKMGRIQYLNPKSEYPQFTLICNKIRSSYSSLWIYLFPNEDTKSWDIMNPYFNQRLEMFCIDQNSPSKAAISTQYLSKLDGVKNFSNEFFIWNSKDFSSRNNEKLDAAVKSDCTVFIENIFHNYDPSVWNIFNNSECERMIILHRPKKVLHMFENLLLSRRSGANDSVFNEAKNGSYKFACFTIANNLIEFLETKNVVNYQTALRLLLSKNKMNYAGQEITFLFCPLAFWFQQNESLISLIAMKNIIHLLFEVMKVCKRLLSDYAKCGKDWIEKDVTEIGSKDFATNNFTEKLPISKSLKRNCQLFEKYFHFIYMKRQLSLTGSFNQLKIFPKLLIK